MEDSMVEDDELIREQTLMQEEAHYFHTINALVELMVVYGFDTVMDSVLLKLGDLKK
jgi:hypothetical protein